MENNDMKYPRIAEALRRIMDDHGGNKAAVARVLNTDATSVAQWLSGSRFPSKPSTLAAIARASGCDLAWLAKADEPADRQTLPDSTLAIDVKSLSPAQKAVWDCIQDLPDDKLEKVLAVVELFWSEVQKDGRGGS